MRRLIGILCLFLFPVLAAAAVDEGGVREAMLVDSVCGPCNAEEFLRKPTAKELQAQLERRTAEQMREDDKWASSGR